MPLRETFANIPKGAAGSAVIFSLIRTALENGLNPYRSRTWLLKTANAAELPQPEIILCTYRFRAANRKVLPDRGS